MSQSPELTGGAGFNFEASAATLYLTALVSEETAPALSNRIVIRVGLQRAAFGEPLDDLIVDARSTNGEIARLSLQVKRSLTISAAATNEDFREVIKNSWVTLKKKEFREDLDRYGGATGTISDASWRDLCSVCEFARASLTSRTFFQRFEANGNASQGHLRIVEILRSILDDCAVQAVFDDDLYRFLKHFVLIKLDFLHEGASDPPQAIAQLRQSLATQESHRAPELLARLETFAREGAGRSEEFSRSSLLAKLAGEFLFIGAPSLKSDLDRLSEWARLSLEDITFEIDGYHLARKNLLDQTSTLLESHRFVQVRGLPGTGKSALLREIAASKLVKGPVLFLKADRLSGRSWAEFATNIGLKAQGIEDLLSEIAATGTAMLFIDGIDRIPPVRRAVVTDLFNTILRSPLLSTWRIVVTSRDVGIEPLRNWLPSELFNESGIGTVDVAPLDDEEAKELSRAKPILRPLLFGIEPVKEIARRPFFASVLARGFSTTTIGANFMPQSEIDLIRVWWERGGYRANTSEIFQRQHALEDLAKASARRQGLRILRSELNPGTIGMLHSLIVDGVIRETQTGVALRFTHDIFFEWSFYYLLQSQDDRWIDLLIGAGEPPVLGRVVELLSQSCFSSNGAWLSNLATIEASSLRPQWQRAWLLGPFGAPDFRDHVDGFERVISQDNFRRALKLFVWVQAEKTIPNPLVLGGRLFSKDLSKHEVIRIADLLGWPSDIGLWRRLLTWTLNRVDSFPCTIIPAVVSTFEVWQNAVADVPNTLSNSIAKKCLEWLVDIEDRRHSEEWNSDYGKWDVLDRDDLDGLEKALRMLVLRSAQTFHPGVKAYLERATQRKHLRSHVFMEVLKFAPLLAQKLSDQLIELTRAELKDELPEDTETRWKREQEEEAKELERIRAKPENERDGFDESILSSLPIYSGFSHHDWTRLSIGRSHQGFFPASPLREPFASLFNYQPQKAVALVKEITNHAITAWLQLHKYDHDRRGTPIPVAIEFPWGRQEFWGDWPHYVWFRGLLGPNSVECGLMALEGWAFREIDSGRVIDEVLRDVVDGHRCWSVLGIAIAIALETQHVSKTTLALLSCQRLWHIDIRRQVEDSGSVSANLIGFIGVTGFKEAEKSHYETVKAGNGKKCRKMSLRDLTMLFALNEDEEIRRLTRKALERFPDNLPFGYEEEKADEARVKELLTTAEIWAEAGKPENYMSKPYPEDESAVLIELQNPKLSNPEIQAALVRHSNKTRELSLWNWVNKTFDNKTLCNDLSLTDAIEYAKQFDHPDLFSSRVSSADSDLLLGAVAGVAATVFCFANPADQNVVAWAAEVISRAYETPEVKYDIYSSGAHLPWHPCIFVARALSAQIRQRYADHSAKEKLLCLVGHPLEQVSLEALVGAFDCWNVDDRFAWTALDLGLRLSVASFRGAVHWSYGYDPAKDLAAREKAVEAALKSYFDASEYTELTSPPQPWVFAPPRTDNLLDGERVSTDPIWREPDEFWRWDFASKVLQRAPIDKIMTESGRQPQFIRLFDELLKWTIEKINPSWEQDDSTTRRISRQISIKRRPSERSELWEWRREFSQVLARVSGHLDAETARRSFLDSIFAQDDDLCDSFLGPFINLYICVYVLDAKTIKPEVIKVLDLCIDRLLDDRAFKRSGYRDGVLYGFDLPSLVRDLFLISIEKADGAARFANGRWEEIGIVLPLIDKFVRAAGWVSSVADAFLTLCERCGACYPAELFADQVLAFLDTNNLPGWQGTTLPARIAGLIQVYSEREHPLAPELAQKLLRILDLLVDLGDRRSAALQISESFKDVRIEK